jgi:hypothetical protein
MSPYKSREKDKKGLKKIEQIPCKEKEVFVSNKGNETYEHL